MEEKKYIYIGSHIDLPELHLSTGSIYYGDKIENILKKYSNLSKLLIDVEKLPTVQKNENYLTQVFEELKKEVEGGNN